ncbi:MAG: GNAT family N-acetyltransferase [Rhodobacteraceae bacterium]|nr:GNAT family N-acetyltransferase [Paracoccaceae bacterium]
MHVTNPILTNGRFLLRLAESKADFDRVLALRQRAFRSGKGPAGPGTDADEFDARCRHIFVEDRATGMVAATFRLQFFDSGAGIGRSYAAGFYDLAALEGYDRPMAEFGRFCLAPGHGDPDLLRLVWSALAALTVGQGVAMAFGCTSFLGTDAAPYGDALAHLGADHGPPQKWRPGVIAPEVVAFAARAPAAGLDKAKAMQQMPPLLRSYLAMGAWVSDHAVIDRDLGTIHVFTALEAVSIPPRRLRALLDLAGRAGPMAVWPDQGKTARSDLETGGCL